MMWWDNGPGWFGLFGGGLVMLLGFVVLGALVVLGVMLAGKRSGKTEAAEDLLAQRFARGEIDEEEFAQRRAVLRGRR